jgi:hypothetical protein
LQENAADPDRSVAGPTCFPAFLIHSDEKECRQKKRLEPVLYLTGVANVVIIPEMKSSLSRFSKEGACKETSLQAFALLMGWLTQIASSTHETVQFSGPTAIAGKL